MEARSLHFLALACGGQLINCRRDTEFVSVSSDSRRIASGVLFWALRGDQFDGHDFVAQAIEAGAVAAVVAAPAPAPVTAVVPVAPVLAPPPAPPARQNSLAGRGLLLVIFGLGDFPQIAIGFLLAVMAVIINTLNGLDRVPPVLLLLTANVINLGADLNAVDGVVVRLGE